MNDCVLKSNQRVKLKGGYNTKKNLERNIFEKNMFNGFSFSFSFNNCPN